MHAFTYSVRNYEDVVLTIRKEYFFSCVETRVSQNNGPLPLQQTVIYCVMTLKQSEKPYQIKGRLLKLTDDWQRLVTRGLTTADEVCNFTLIMNLRQRTFHLGREK
jgi:hypothetical protein